MSDDTNLAGPKILLQGDSGSGKTFSIGTAVDWAEKNGTEVFCLFTESGLETLLGYWSDPPRDPGGKPVRPARAVPANLHWHVSRAPALNLSSLIDGANKVGLLNYESLTKMTDPNRGANNPYEKILRSLADFPDDRTGKKFGNIGEWGPNRILCIDSLTQLGDACMKMVIGSKPTASQPDYGVAQNNLMNFLRYLTQALRCTVVMTAHVQRQVNEITGGVQLMTKAIGKAMADDIPPLFSEVIYCLREGPTWYWDTAAVGVTTKTRYLQVTSKIPPDLGVILDRWKTRSQAAS